MVWGWNPEENAARGYKQVVALIPVIFLVEGSLFRGTKWASLVNRSTIALSQLLLLLAADSGLCFQAFSLMADALVDPLSTHFHLVNVSGPAVMMCMSS